MINNFAKIALISALALAEVGLTKKLTSESYYEPTDAQDVDDFEEEADPISLKYYGSYYNWTYGAYYSGYYYDDTFDWYWFMFIFVCCVPCIIYHKCKK